MHCLTALSGMFLTYLKYYKIISVWQFFVFDLRKFPILSGPAYYSASISLLLFTENRFPLFL